MVKAKGLVHEYLRLIWSDRKALVGLTIILSYASTSIIGPLIIPLDLTPKPLKRMQPPSWEHLLGTDYAGRDLAAQIVHGSREVLTIAFTAGLITTLIGIAIGLTSGFLGGKVDLALMSIADMVLTIPGFMLLMLIATFLGGKVIGLFEAACLLSITAWAGLARAVRSQVLSIKEEGFIEAVKALGLGKLHIIFNEVMPSLMPYIAMSLFLGMTGAIYAFVGLTTLGFLPYNPTNWGTMLRMAQAYGGTLTSVRTAHMLSPAFIIIILQTALVMFAGGIDKIFNPRLREE